MNTFEYTHDQILCRIQWYHDYLISRLQSVKDEMNEEHDIEETTHLFVQYNTLDDLLQDYVSTFRHVLAVEPLHGDGIDDSDPDI